MLLLSDIYFQNKLVVDSWPARRRKCHTTSRQCPASQAYFIDQIMPLLVAQKNLPAVLKQHALDWQHSSPMQELSCISTSKVRWGSQQQDFKPE